MVASGPRAEAGAVHIVISPDPLSPVTMWFVLNASSKIYFCRPCPPDEDPANIRPPSTKNAIFSLYPKPALVDEMALKDAVSSVNKSLSEGIDGLKLNPLVVMSASKQGEGNDTWTKVETDEHRSADGQPSEDIYMWAERAVSLMTADQYIDKFYSEQALFDFRKYINEAGDVPNVNEPTDELAITVAIPFNHQELPK
jgi:hypothetical protein